MLKRDTITFVCTANICRSPMAEYLFRHALDAEEEPVRSLNVLSAGIAAWTGEPQTTNSVAALKKVGISPRHESQPLSQVILNRSFAVFCMTKAHKQAIQSNFGQMPPYLLRMKELIPYLPEEEIDIVDPYGQSLPAYEACRDEMVEAIPFILPFIKTTYSDFLKFSKA